MRFTRRARLDLLDLWRHVAAHDSGRAHDLLDRIEASCRVLRDLPRFGHARPDIGEGAWMLVIERWIALYCSMGDDVQVVRIVDGARDLGQLGWAATARRGE